MAFTPEELTAISNLKEYNENTFDSITNPKGLAGQGYQTNIPAGFNDMGIATDAAAREAIATAASALLVENNTQTVTTTASAIAQDKIEINATKDSAVTAKDAAITAAADSIAAKDSSEAARDAAQASAAALNIRPITNLDAGRALVVNAAGDEIIPTDLADSLPAVFASDANKVVSVNANGDGYLIKFLDKVSNISSIDPTAQDDETVLYDEGSIWVNLSSKQTFVCTDSTVNNAIWERTSLLNNFTASAVPLPTNDTSEGYSNGSKWFYNGDIWVLVDASTGAAVWVDTGLQIDDLGTLALLDEVEFTQIATNAIASQAEAESGTATNKLMNPLRTKQAITNAVNSFKSSPIFAWANINGATAAIRASTGFSSIVRNSGGTYTTTFTTPRPDANYVISVTAGNLDGGAGSNAGCQIIAMSTTGFQFEVGVASTNLDYDQVHISVLGA